MSSATNNSNTTSSSSSNKRNIRIDTNFNITRQPRTGSSKRRIRKPAFPPVYHQQQHYVSKSLKRKISFRDLPNEPNYVGMYSPYAFIWGGVSATVPIAWIYIGLILLRELGLYSPRFDSFLLHYIPSLVHFMQQRSSRLVEVWCILEAIWFVGLKIYVRYLETRDPLEACLRSAPFMKPKERSLLWQRMMEVERKDPAALISGWFFDQDIHKISRYDVREFITWSMFEGRNQEHLTGDELEQLETFVQELEYSISVHWYGVHEPDSENEDGQDANEDNLTVDSQLTGDTDISGPPRPVPRKMFRFPEMTQHAPPNFFSNLYESYRRSYEKYRAMMETSDFHPVEDFRNFMATTTQQIIEAEENAVATATQTAENAMVMANQTAESAMVTATQTATQMYETIITPGSQVDQRLTAMREATQTQLINLFNSVKQGMKERLETAKILSTRRKQLQQQLKGYREMLNRTRSNASSEVPSQQMAFLMRRITKTNEALERLEARAREAFDQATGYARKNLAIVSAPQPEPQRYAKYSCDPLLGLVTYPLGFHLLILGATEIPLRIQLAKKGFERKNIGSVNYYFHPGTKLQEEYEDIDFDDDDNNKDNTPIVFVHGIGVGLVMYMPLIDALLESGRPIFLPELPFVSGFRPWLGPNAVLPPAVVCSTMTAMLASHGYLKGAFCGHSYGTSWLAYMCKYAPDAVTALLFLDPICFCLHSPRLTKKFVYHKPDPGTIAYIVRTDITVNLTIQRGFPWAWIILFAEQVHVPCSVFLSEEDALVPAQKVEEYMNSKGAKVVDFKPGMSRDHFDSDDMTGCVFRGHGHGDWTDYPTHTVPAITECLEVLCNRAERNATSSSD